MNGTVILKRIVLLIALFALTACGGGGDSVPPGLDVTGTWKGELPIGSTSRGFTFQLHRRSDGNVMGYVVGGTAYRTVIAGSMSGTALTLEVELKDPKLTRTLTIEGTITGNNFVGTADDGSETQAISWQRVRQVLHERRFLFASPPINDGEPTGVTELSVVLKENGDFVSGGFVGEEDCDLFACGGGLTSFTETSDSGGNEMIEIGLESGGGSCTVTGLLQATFDSSTKFYTGTYSMSHCMGTNAGNLLGVKTTRTQTDHVASILTTFGRLADDLETRIHFTAPYGPFSSDYLHKSLILSDRLDELNDQTSIYASIDVDFTRFRNIYTVEDPDIFPEMDTVFQVDFHDRRSAIHLGRGPLPFVYRDVDSQSGHDELKYLAREGDNWVIYGDHISHDLPFASYSFADDHVVIPASGGNIYLSIGTWGAHSGPHTGHLEGNAKADWGGQYAWTLDQLTELAGDSDGVCESGETCGITQVDLEARIVNYVAPTDNFKITGVTLEWLTAPGEYYGSNESWRVEANVGQYRYGFGHLRDISSNLRDAMIAAGYTDPWSVHTASSNLITGEPVTIAKGQTLARPQTVAIPVPGHPGYFTGKWTTPETPWQQIEFFTYNNDARREESFYTWLAPSLENQLAAIFQAQGLNPAVFRFNQPFLSGTERIWKAEMALSNQAWMDRDDYSGLFSALGGWWETMGGPCDGISHQCDSMFSIFPIRKDTVFYNPGLYHHPDVSYLAGWRQGSNTYFGEVITPAEPDPISGTLIIKWTLQSGVLIGYQGVGYRLDTTGRMLRIGWSDIVSTESDVVLPSIPSNAVTCNGTTLTCYNHEWNGDNV